MPLAGLLAEIKRKRFSSQAAGGWGFLEMGESNMAGAPPCGGGDGQGPQGQWVRRGLGPPLALGL